MNPTIYIDDQRLLTRVGAASALTDAGFPISPSTLATLATRGSGPPFQRFGVRVLYPWWSTLEWAQRRLGPVVTSTSAAIPGHLAVSGASDGKDDSGRYQIRTRPGQT